MGLWGTLSYIEVPSLCDFENLVLHGTSMYFSIRNPFELKLRRPFLRVSLIQKINMWFFVSLGSGFIARFIHACSSFVNFTSVSWGKSKRIAKSIFRIFQDNCAWFSMVFLCFPSQQPFFILDLSKVNQPVYSLAGKSRCSIYDVIAPPSSPMLGFYCLWRPYNIGIWTKCWIGTIGSGNSDRRKQVRDDQTLQRTTHSGKIVLSWFHAQVCIYVIAIVYNYTYTYMQLVQELYYIHT